MRYVVKKEFYGAFCYDRANATGIALDEESFQLLKDYADKIAVDDDFVQNLIDEEFIIDGKPNYSIIENEHVGTTLSAPGRLHFYYTYACNLNCKHCFSKNNAALAKKELTFEEKLMMLDEMQKLGICEILIGGGEPFIKKDFFDFVEECLRREIVTKVFTNGLLLTQNIIDRIAGWKLKYLSISIDGINDEEYAKLRGVSGISILKNNIRLLRAKANYPVAISITVNTFNYNSYAQYLQLMEEIRIDRLKIRPTKPSGNVYENKDVYLTAEQYVHFVKNIYQTWLKDYSDKFDLDCSWGDARVYYDEESNQLDILADPFPYEGFGCFAGKASMVMDACGYVLPCGFLPEAMQRTESDKFPQKSLKEIWDNGKRFVALRGVPANEECPNCEYYGSCRGGCIARILFAKKKLNDVDPWCPKKFFPIKF